MDPNSKLMAKCSVNINYFSTHGAEKSVSLKGSKVLLLIKLFLYSSEIITLLLLIGS